MVEGFERTIWVAATEFFADQRERHASSRLARESANPTRQTPRNIRNAGERASRLHRHRRQEDLCGARGIQTSAVLVGRWERSVRLEVQC